jgi:hypothetical protein
MAMSRVADAFTQIATAVLVMGIAVTSPALAETLDRPASADELTALAAAYEQGALGTGSCPWWNPVSDTPTTIPCEAIPLPLLASFARNAANKHAQLELGKRYEEGRGVTQDFDMARKFYRMAARDLRRGRPIQLPGRDLSPLSFGEVGHGGTLIEAGFNRPRVPGFISAVGLPEARERLRQLPK